MHLIIISNFLMKNAVGRHRWTVTRLTRVEDFGIFLSSTLQLLASRVQKSLPVETLCCLSTLAPFYMSGRETMLSQLAVSVRFRWIMLEWRLKGEERKERRGGGEKCRFLLRTERDDKTSWWNSSVTCRFFNWFSIREMVGKSGSSSWYLTSSRVRKWKRSQ